MRWGFKVTCSPLGSYFLLNSNGWMPFLTGWCLWVTLGCTVACYFVLETQLFVGQALPGPPQLLIRFNRQAPNLSVCPRTKGRTVSSEWGAGVRHTSTLPQDRKVPCSRVGLCNQTASSFSAGWVLVAVRASSGCSQWRLLFVVVSFSLWPTGLVAPWHVGSSQNRDQTGVSWIGGQTLLHGATREAPCCSVAHSCLDSLRPHGLQASLSFTISWSLLRLMSIKSVMPSNQLILCCPLLLLQTLLQF